MIVKGNKYMKCEICGYIGEGKIYMVPERMINLGDIFEYLLCPNCGVLKRNDVLGGVEKYYGMDYYAFSATSGGFLYRIKHKLECIILLAVIHGIIPEIIFRNNIKMWRPAIASLFKTHLNKNTSILDIGGGNGKWLEILYRCGYKNLTNIDLYCSDTDNPIKFVKTDFLEYKTDAIWDVIALHHSFEHMDAPDEVLEKCRRLLSDKGMLIIRIPIMGKWAWETYGVSWYQIDAPRHKYIYTEEAMSILCKRHGLKIEKVVYDSTAAQICISDMYANTDRAFLEFDRKNISKENKKFVRYLNATNNGDQACFYIRKEI